jgi:signal transduction histidine kinase/ligand-binding sensor domain-containing protein
MAWIPVRVFSTIDGLPHNHVSKIRRDSRGYLWFCTDDGLSRWDGYGFKTFTTSDGLPHAHIDDLLETRKGVYWIATDGGLARLQPEAQGAAFTAVFPDTSLSSREVNVLLEDRDGAVLLGTSAGLYRLEQTSTGVRISSEAVGFPEREHDGLLVNTLLLARDGQLWLGAGSGIYTRTTDGRWQRFDRSNGLPVNFINQLREDSQGRIWACTRGGGLVELSRTPDQATLEVIRVFTEADRLPSGDVRDVFVFENEHLWVGTANGLAVGSATGRDSAMRFRSHFILNGVADQSLYWFAPSAAGDIWMGTGTAGAIRISQEGFQSYGAEENFHIEEINQIVETRDGHVCVVNGNRSRRQLQCIDGDHFTQKRLQLQQWPLLRFGFEWSQFALEDQYAQWWLATERGAVRTSSRGARFITMLPAPTGTLHMFEDSHGLIWLSEANFESLVIARWNPVSETSEIVWRDSSPNYYKRGPSSFAEDRAGQIWVGMSGQGGLLRWRRDHFESLTSEDGVPPGEVTDLYVDRSGRLWIASGSGGLGMLTDSTADRPTIRAYDRRHGLTTNEVWCVTEDRSGHIYAGTGKGVDAIEFETGRVMHFTSDDGLVAGPVRACLGDRSGELWFATNRGLSRFSPLRQSRRAGVEMLITQFRVRSNRLKLPLIGSRRVGPFVLQPSEDQVAIDFVGLDSRLRGDLQYQYHVSPVDTSWSTPSPERSVTFARLVPGSYRFEVRAIDVSGKPSEPAIAYFSISPPYWKRWWALSLLAITLVASLYGAHRRRMRHVLELERVRMRIATDLHDDVGASLSRVAIISELVSRRAEPDRKALADISATARAVLQSMSEIVWSIDPSNDNFQDLRQRMRWYAGETLSHSGTVLHFSSTGDSPELRLSIEMRRQVYLIFKESVTNLSRHAQARHCYITIKVGEGQLVLEVTDDGQGFDPGRHVGHGLRNMALRARTVNATVEVQSHPGEGTTVRLCVPLRQSRHWWRRIAARINMRRGDRRTTYKI